MTLLFFYLFVAIGVSFLCSVLEAVLLSITPAHVENLMVSKPRSGELLTKVRNKLDVSLSSILILNTFAHTIGAVGVGSQAVSIYGERWETLIAILLTLTILYVSEIIPKTLGATYWRKLAVPSALIISWLVRLVYPLVWFATRLTRLFSDGKEHQITREEILALASLGYKGGTLGSQEIEYLQNILNLREIRIEQVLTPRSVVHMLSEAVTVSEALDQEETRQFTRMPVYRDDIDDVIGHVIDFDLYEAERAGHGSDLIKQHTKPIQRVSEKLPMHKLLDYFIKHKVHMCLVEDEFGQSSGIVTLEDAIETLLGREIVDESDQVEDMQALARGRYRNRLRTDKK
jgi:CBS domain containing-hemolysin-like protein